MNRTNGKIAEESREKLVQALLRVMERYDYREITVTQIAQEAGLSRKTFYRLFKDKDEVLAWLFDESFQECFGRIKARDLHHYWDVVQVFFDFWEERKELLTLMQKNRLLSRVIEQSYEYWIRVFAFVRSQETADSLALPLPYLLAYSAGGMHSMLFKWAEGGMTIPSEELIEALKQGFRSEEL